MEDFGCFAAKLDEKLPLKVLVPAEKPIRKQMVSLSYIIQLCYLRFSL